MANRNGNPIQQPATGHLGPIDPGVLYPIEVLRRLAGLGDTSMRNARRRGLTDYRFGGRKFVLGADFIEFIQANSGTAPGPQPDDAGAQ